VDTVAAQSECAGIGIHIVKAYGALIFIFVRSLTGGVMVIAGTQVFWNGLLKQAFIEANFRYVKTTISGEPALGVLHGYPHAIGTNLGDLQRARPPRSDSELCLCIDLNLY